MEFFYFANARIPTEKAHGHQIMKMCGEFAAAGANLTLVLPTRVSAAFENIDAFDYYHSPRNFKMEKLKSFDPFWLMKWPGAVYLKGQAIFFMAALFFYLRRRGREGGQLDSGSVFYTRDEYLLPFLEKFSNKVVWEGHALPRNIKWYLPSFKRAWRLIVLTQAMKNQLAAAGVAPEKILVAPDAVDLKVFGLALGPKPAREILHLPQDKIILGYTGAFKTKGMDKGIADILKALKILAAENILFLAIGGSAADIDYYQRIAAQEGVADQAKFLGKVPQSELAVYQKAMDALLMPFPFNQHYAYYMSPLKMFEYMASRRPIIASDLPSIREVLNENNAVLVTPDQPAGLAEGIKKVLQNQPLSDKIREAAYQTAKEYTWEKRAEKIIKFIS